MPKQPGRAEPRNWQRLDTYLAIHDRCMESLSYFIERDSLTFTFTHTSQLLIEGEVYCQGGKTTATIAGFTHNPGAPQRYPDRLFAPIPVQVAAG